MSLVEEVKTLIDKGFSPNNLQAYEGLELIEDEIVDQGRWFVYYRAVYKSVGNESMGLTGYVAVVYAEPATEYQDADDEPVEVYAVEPYEVRATKYRKV